MDYHVVVGWKSKPSYSEVLARLTGRELPRAAELVQAFNGYCEVYSSRWLGHVIFGLPRQRGGRLFRTGYIIVYVPTREGANRDRANLGFRWNGESASLVPQCRG